MTDKNNFNPKIRERQERRIRWQHGLTEAQARVVAILFYGGSV